ncbi:MAG TPA: CaiB/BaiF CoA-transferase family protein [Acidimicrobiia bacterium]|nr:CaiB/BaiF CoA-transferase family protein [Acidimicrobiia bacterium]
MRLGDVANPDAARYGKPLDGIRILAAEQMQALPFGTQLLARLGAEVVKVEQPGDGESGRGALPAMTDPTGHRAGATFLRNNLSKRSVAIDLKAPAGRDLFLELAGRFDVVAENFKPGTMARMGLGYEDLAARYPRLIYVSVSGFGNTVASPYDSWAAYAPIVEAMSGIYAYKQPPDEPPVVAPVGALGDISSAMFAVIGTLAALRARDQTGEGQYVDVAMLDAVVAMTDLVTNFWSMGLRPGGLGPLLIMDGFRAHDGWFVVQVGREHQFERLAKIVGEPGWLDDPRFATREGWRVHLDDVIRPAIEGWAAAKTKLEAARELNEAGIAAGPVNTAPDVIDDPHVAARHMLVEVPRTDGEPPYLVPGNPVKLTKVADGPETRVPWVGEHTDEVLRAELGLDDAALAALHGDGVIG